MRYIYVIENIHNPSVLSAYTNQRTAKKHLRSLEIDSDIHILLKHSQYHLQILHDTVNHYFLYEIVDKDNYTRPNPHNGGNYICITAPLHTD